MGENELHGKLMFIDKTIVRFKRLNEPQNQLLLSASKEPGKYTDGVVLFKKNELMFRSVPPRLVLPLTMTELKEKEEKKERYDLMKQHNCSELEAAF